MMFYRRWLGWVGVLLIIVGMIQQPTSAAEAPPKVTCHLDALTIGLGSDGAVAALPTWLQGVWSTWSETEERRIVLRADGQYIVCVTEYVDGTQTVEHGTWSFDDGLLLLQKTAGQNRIYLPLVNRGATITSLAAAHIPYDELVRSTAPPQSSEAEIPMLPRSRCSVASVGLTADSNTANLYQVERIDDTTFRLAGGDLGLRSWLFSRVAAATDPLYPGRWFVGVWSSRPDSRHQTTWTFNTDGTYRTETRQNTSSSSPSVAQGTWRTEAQGLFLTSSTGQQQQYGLRVSSRQYVYLKQAAGDEELLSRESTPEVSAGDPFSGQFSAGKVTLRLTPEDGQYRGELIVNGERSNFTTTPEDGQLSFSIPRYGETRPIVLTPAFNGLTVVSRPALLAGQLAEHLTQIASTPLPDPTGLTGIWISPSLSALGDLNLTILQDQRYFYFYDDDRFEDGLLAAPADQLRFDPACDPPYAKPYQLVGNQLVITQQDASGNDLPQGYQFVPASDALLARLTPEIDAANAAENAIWQQRIALAPRDPNFEAPAVPNPIPGGLLAVDPQPNEVFADATVFAVPQGYLWLEAPFGCIDYGTPGRRCNTMRFIFFPNGRAVFFSETYVDLPGFQWATTPMGNFIWLPYRIEDDRLFVGEAAEFELLIGRRRIRLNEVCFDNATWLNAQP